MKIALKYITKSTYLFYDDNLPAHLNTLLVPLQCQMIKPSQISLQPTTRQLNHKKWNQCHLLEALAICHFIEVQNTNILYLLYLLTIFSKSLG